MGDPTDSTDPSTVPAAAAPTLRWEVGDAMGVVVPAAPGPGALPSDPAPSRKVDVKPRIRGLVGENLVVAYPPFDPATAAAPVETRAYFLKAGDPIPATAADWTASGVPYASSTDPVPAAGVEPYPLVLAGVEPGNYLVQILLGFNDAAA